MLLFAAVRLAVFLNLCFWGEVNPLLSRFDFDGEQDAHGGIIH